MQRLSCAAQIDEATLVAYQQMMSIIQRHLPPSLALLYATARRGAEGNLEWWTERQGVARPLAGLSQDEQVAVQNKRQQYQNIIADLIDKLNGMGEEQSASALRTLLNHSQGLECFDVAGEPVLTNWSLLSEETPFTKPTPVPEAPAAAPVAAPLAAAAIAPVVAQAPWWKRWLPLLLLLLLLLLLGLGWWYWQYAHRKADIALPVEQPVIPVNSPELPKVDTTETLPVSPAELIPPAPEVTQPVVPPEPEVTQPVVPPVPQETKFVGPPAPKPKPYVELTKDNPEVTIAKRKNFDRIKVNLKWGQGKNKEPLDLDVGAIVVLKSGKKIEVDALSELWGDYASPPYANLPKDLRNGNSKDGEWLYINGNHWQDIDEVLIHSLVYSGLESWKGTGATVTIYIPGQKPIRTSLVGSDKNSTVAAIAKLKNVNGSIVVQRLGNVFPGRQEMTDYFGYGIHWGYKLKD